MTWVQIAVVLLWAWACLLRAPLMALHRHFALRMQGNDHDAGRRAELAWWNDAREHAKRHALRAANDLSPSVSELAQDYGTQFVLHAECVGRPMVLIVGEDYSVVSNPDNTVGPRGRY